jgi:ATP-dependent DNA helicase 2 subunit 1
MLAVRHIFQTKIISSDRDMMSVVLYGTKESKSPNHSPGVYVLQDLDMPDAARIVELGQLAKSKSGEFAPGHSPLGSEFQLFEAVWTAQSVLATRPSKDAYTEVHIFACHDNPNSHSAELRTRAIQRLRDLTDSGTTVTVQFVFPQSRREANGALFYSEALPTDDPDVDPMRRFKVLTTQEEAIQHVRIKEYRKRPIARIGFQVGSSSIGVSVFKTIQEAKKPPHVWLNAATSEIVKATTNWVDGRGELVDVHDTAALPAEFTAAAGKAPGGNPSTTAATTAAAAAATTTGSTAPEFGLERLMGGVGTYHEFGGEKIPFSKEDMNHIKRVTPPALQLLGFKPLRMLKREHNVRGSSFVYPDDDSVTGSAAAFSALHAEMMAAGVFAVCRLVAREASSPKLVALIAQAHVTTADGTLVHPNGFILIDLPFADEIRALELPSRTPTDAQVAAAKGMIKNINMEYKVHDFLNPTLQKTYAFIAAMALGSAEPEHIEDTIMPDKEGFRAKRRYTEAFKEALFAKRKPTAEDDEWIAAYHFDGLKKKTIPVIKEYLKTISQPGTGTKGELVERFRAFWDLPAKPPAAAAAAAADK